MAKVSNWGNYPVVDAEMRGYDTSESARELVASWPSLIARGLGRSYGDASLSPRIASTLRHNKLLAFDEETGDLRCQGGVSLEEILEVFVPRGWFPPVTPGTRYVTVGGAIAADVHGKNHHCRGSFRRHVSALEVLVADGRIVACGPNREQDLFDATCGGMGLTGIILSATFRLQRIETAYIRQEVLPARDLDHIMQRFEESRDWTYSVAWIDCLARGDKLGRSLLIRGEHALPQDLDTAPRGAAPLQPPPGRRAAVPIPLPGMTLNRFSVGAFNALYYRWHGLGGGHRIVPYGPFFYPLDAIGHWNRIYGRHGFIQYQCVLPLAFSREGLAAILERIGKRGWGSFLAVLKLFGPQEGLMSFPLEGYTLALDFPLRDGLLPFLDELDELVEAAGGRLYLAKDARMKSPLLASGYPHRDRFLEIVRIWNPDGRFRSMLSDRLDLTPPRETP